MKKIVALVLAMVMVLGLATTAFAAKGGDTFDTAKVNYDWDFTVTAEDAEDSKDQTFATYTIEAEAKKDGAEAFWDPSLDDVEKGDKEDVEIDGEDEFVKVAAGMPYDVAIIDGKVTTYYAVAETYNEDGWDAEAKEVTLPVLPLDDADRECNTMYAYSAATATCYFVDGVLYSAFSEENAIVLNVKGVCVIAGETDMKAGLEDVYCYIPHDYQVKYSDVIHTNGTDFAVSKVYCDNCTDTFKFVEGPEEVALAVFGTDNYQPIDEDGFLWTELVAPAVPGVSAAAGGSAAGSDAAGDKVESAETFDAGIAMYVGMSVMAAAGSAVVLKKKD